MPTNYYVLNKRNPNKGRPLKKLAHKSILIEIQRIRSRNNRLWMKLMALALASKPRQAKAIMSKIVANDMQVTRWTSRL